MLNHETDSIYNDVVKFPETDKQGALDNFKSYPEVDATVILRGSDGEILKKKGNESYIGQNLAYIYNDFESQGILSQKTYQHLMAPTEE